MVGHFDRNRALPEDLVVVRLRPRDQWTPRDIMNTPTPKIIPILTSVGQMLDDAATTTINDSFGVGVDPIARYTPPQLNSAMVCPFCALYRQTPFHCTPWCGEHANALDEGRNIVSPHPPLALNPRQLPSIANHYPVPSKQGPKYRDAPTRTPFGMETLARAHAPCKLRERGQGSHPVQS